MTSSILLPVRQQPGDPEPTGSEALHRPAQRIFATEERRGFSQYFRAR